LHLVGVEAFALLEVLDISLEISLDAADVGLWLGLAVGIAPHGYLTPRIQIQ
jgi:hypothetical protein